MISYRPSFLPLGFQIPSVFAIRGGEGRIKDQGREQREQSQYRYAVRCHTPAFQRFAIVEVERFHFGDSVFEPLQTHSRGISALLRSDVFPKFLLVSVNLRS